MKNAAHAPDEVVDEVGASWHCVSNEYGSLHHEDAIVDEVDKVDEASPDSEPIDADGIG